MTPHLIVTAALATSLLVSTGPSSRSAHDKAFWRAIAQNGYVPPAGEPLPGLVAELSGYLASSDPELRDDIAYSTLANWIYRQKIVPVELRRSLLNDWTANLTKGIGERGTDTVLLRSFSALSLGILVIADNETPYLEKPEFDRLLAAALAYFKAERDVRGFDETKGWMHSVAHTSDLLKFLARSRYLEPAQQSRILTALSEKASSVTEVLTHGEDERMARAALSIAARKDFDEAAFRAWAPGLVARGPSDAPTAATLATAQNRKNLAVALFTVLSTDQRDLPSLKIARDVVLAALKTIM